MPKFNLTLLFFILLFFNPKALLAAELNDISSSPIELIAYVFGGIGIFLIGIHYAGENLQKITGGTFRKIVNRLGGYDLGLLISGLVLGFFTQNGRAMAFIMSDFVQAGMLKITQATSIIYWANAGSSLIVFASMGSVKVLALFILGFSALGITFNVPKILVKGYGALFGLAMMMYGLYLVKEGASGFAGLTEVQNQLENIRGLHVIGFDFGLFMTLLVQSNLAVIMVNIAFAASGFFDLEMAAMGMYGAQAGTAIITYIFSFRAQGQARQVVATQIFYDVIATVVFVILFCVEYYASVPLVLSAARALSDNVGTQAVVVALTFQFGSALLLVILNKPVLRIVVRLLPKSAAEVLSEPEFLHKHAADSPETALMLIEKEQIRLFQRFPEYIDYVRMAGLVEGKIKTKDYHEAFITLSSTIGKTLSIISGHAISHAVSNHLIQITKRHEQLVNLEDIVYQLTGQVEAQDPDSWAGDLGRNIMESLDFMILTAIESMQAEGESEISTLKILTQDRSKVMTRIRNKYFESEKDLSQHDRNFVLDVTILFENAIYTLSRYGNLLTSS